MCSKASSPGYERAYDENGQIVYMVGDKYMSREEAAEYAQYEADELAALGDPEAYDGYPTEIAPVRPGTVDACQHPLENGDFDFGKGVWHCNACGADVVQDAHHA